MHQHTSLLLVLVLGFVSALTTNEITGLLAITTHLSPLHRDWDPADVANACSPTWDGLECDQNAHITHIALGVKGIYGQIPTEIGLFQDLESLNLIGNEINGSLPTEIASLTKLQHLFLSVNHLTGPIPTQLNALRALENIFLDRNNFSGVLPEFTLPRLQMFVVSTNKLYGTLSTTLGLLTAMADMDLGTNQFSGTIPTELGRMTRLTLLYLDENQLSGIIPTEFANLKMLNKIDLSYNRLTGPLPAFVGLEWLNTITITENHVTGNLPSAWNSLPRLKTIDVSNNTLSGLLSPSIFFGRPSHLDDLFIKNNYFFGPLPDFQETLNVDISGNYFYNSIPKSSNPLGLPVLKHKEFNKTCCCSTSCPVCSGYICPNSLGGPLTVNPGTDITISTPIVANQIVNSGTLHVANTTVSTTTLILLNTTTFVGVKLNTTYFSVFSGITSANSSNLTITGGLQLAPGANLQISKTTMEINGTFEALGALLVTGEHPIVVDCFVGGASSSIILEISPELQHQIEQSGFQIQLVSATGANCVTGSFGSYGIAAPSGGCYSMSMSTTSTGISASIQPCNPTPQVVGGIIGSSVLLLIIIATIVLSYWQISKAGLRSLPQSLRWQWEQYYLNPALWKYKGEGATKVFYQKLQKSSQEWNQMSDVLNNCLDGKDIQIAEAFALFQPGLIQNFVNNREVRARRVRDAPHLFNRQSWKDAEDRDPNQLRRMIKHKVSSAIERASESAVVNFQKSADLADLDSFTQDDLQSDLKDAPTKSWVYDRYLARVAKCDWNEEGEQVPILATAHGTDLGTGWAIAQTGFAKLSLLDKGFYGTGIYFTSYALYTYPYFATKRPPALILSYVVPGNVFPVNEHHQGFESLLGAPIQAGYDSNYVVTTANGHVPNTTNLDESQIFDELVVSSEGSIAPAYLIALDTSNFDTLTQKWTRLSPSAAIQRKDSGLATILAPVLDTPKHATIFSEPGPSADEEVRLSVVDLSGDDEEVPYLGAQ